MKGKLIFFLGIKLKKYSLKKYKKVYILIPIFVKQILEIIFKWVAKYVCTYGYILYLICLFIFCFRLFTYQKIKIIIFVFRYRERNLNKKKKTLSYYCKKKKRI